MGYPRNDLYLRGRRGIFTAFFRWLSLRGRRLQFLGSSQILRFAMFEGRSADNSLEICQEFLRNKIQFHTIIYVTIQTSLNHIWVGSILIINMINNLISNNSEMCPPHWNMSISIRSGTTFNNYSGIIVSRSVSSAFCFGFHDFALLPWIIYKTLFRKYINSLINRDRNHRYRCFVLLEFCSWFCSIKKMKKNWCNLCFQGHDNEYPNTVYNSLHPSSLWRDIEISCYYQGLHHCHNFSQLPKDTQIARFFCSNYLPWSKMPTINETKVENSIAMILLDQQKRS